jgi:hypothetical protein
MSQIGTNGKGYVMYKTKGYPASMLIVGVDNTRTKFFATLAEDLKFSDSDDTGVNFSHLARNYEMSDLLSLLV